MARSQAGFPAFTTHTISTEAAFRAELVHIRQRGYATAREELMYRLASVAAPVLDPQGVARAAVSITGSVLELGEHPERQARLVLIAAQRLGRVLQRKAPPIS
jgi:DNA-binding IclR family transcriptional regulator